MLHIPAADPNLFHSAEIGDGSSLHGVHGIFEIPNQNGRSCNVSTETANFPRVVDASDLPKHARPTRRTSRTIYDCSKTFETSWVVLLGSIRCTVLGLLMTTEVQHHVLLGTPLI